MPFFQKIASQISKKIVMSFAKNHNLVEQK